MIWLCVCVCVKDTLSKWTSREKKPPQLWLIHEGLENKILHGITLGCCLSQTNTVGKNYCSFNWTRKTSEIAWTCWHPAPSSLWSWKPEVVKPQLFACQTDALPMHTLKTTLLTVVSFLRMMECSVLLSPELRTWPTAGIIWEGCAVHRAGQRWKSAVCCIITQRI